MNCESACTHARVPRSPRVLRSQLKAVLGKTSLVRQAELVALLAGSHLSRLGSGA
jgi:hypothetical protein